MRAVIQFAKLSGFSPIITTASKHNEAYCKSAGATHVLDSHEISYEELPGAVAKITGGTPLTFVYNATSNPESQKAAWEVLGQNGTMVVVNPPSDAIVKKQGKGDKKGRRAIWVFGVANHPDHYDFGAEMYAELTRMFEDGDLKVYVFIVSPALADELTAPTAEQDREYRTRPRGHPRRTCEAPEG